MNAQSKQTRLYEEMFQQREDLAKLLKLIAHESRLMVLCLLEKKEMTVGEINEQIGLSQSALSQHLAIMRKNDIVSTRRKSQTIYYKLSDKNLSKLIHTLRNIYCK